MAFANKKVQVVDSLLISSRTAFASMDYFKSFSDADTALDIALREGYKLGIVKSCIYRVKVLIEFGLAKEAIVLLTDNRQSYKSYYNAALYSENARLMGRAYGQLNLNKQAIDWFIRQLNFADKIEDVPIKNQVKIWAYENLYTSYLKVEKLDSAIFYLQEQEYIINTTKDDAFYYDQVNLWCNKANIAIKQQEMDLAKLYLDKGYQLLLDNNSIYYYFIFDQYGSWAKAKGDIPLAIYYWEKALYEADSLGVEQVKLDFYKKLGEAYAQLKSQPDKVQHYILAYNQLEEQINADKDEAISFYLQEIENDLSEKKIRIYLLRSLLVLILLGILGYILVRYKKNKNSPPILSNEKVDADQVRDVLVVEDSVQNKKKEADRIAQIELLMAKAKDNSAEFFCLFQEVYPEVAIKISSLNPEMSNTEMSFLAMWYLDLSAKDIATFQFVTLRAIQMRKNRIRKKYNIPSEVKFHQWLQAL